MRSWKPGSQTCIFFNFFKYKVLVLNMLVCSTVMKTNFKLAPVSCHCKLNELIPHLKNMSMQQTVDSSRGAVIVHPATAEFLVKRYIWFNFLQHPWQRSFPGAVLGVFLLFQKPCQQQCLRIPQARSEGVLKLASIIFFFLFRLMPSMPKCRPPAGSLALVRVVLLLTCLSGQGISEICLDIP